MTYLTNRMTFKIYKIQYSIHLYFELLFSFITLYLRNKYI